MEYKEIRRGWVKEDPVRTDDLSDYAFTGESGGHKFIITAFDKNMTEITLTDTVSAKCIIANGDTIPLSGTIQNGKAIVFLPGSCCTVPGRFRLSIFLTHGSSSVCIYTGIGSVVSTDTGARIDPSGVIPNLTQLQTAAETANAAAESAQRIADNYAADVARQDAAISGMQEDIAAQNTAIDEVESKLAEDEAEYDSRIADVEERVSYVASRGSNLYRYRLLQMGVIVYSSNGTLHDDGSYATTDYIDVTSGVTYKVAYWDDNANAWGNVAVYGNYAFYNANKEYVSGGTSGLTVGVAAPSGAAFIRFSIRFVNPSWSTDEQASALSALGKTYFGRADAFPTSYEGYYKIANEIALNTTICAAFSDTEEYHAGDYCTYDGVLYKCTATTHSGAWDKTHFAIAAVMDEMANSRATYTDDGWGNITIT